MKTITNFSDLDLNQKYSYADYLLWQFSERVELIKGRILEMSPAPLRVHQEIRMFISNVIYNYLKGKSYNIYNAPFDVRLIKEKGKSNKDIETLVQPDICVICDESKLDDYGCIGAPDFIIEISSKSTKKKDEVYNTDYTKKMA
jgi:Uma2 family endonuclease